MCGARRRSPLVMSALTHSSASRRSIPSSRGASARLQRVQQVWTPDPGGLDLGPQLVSLLPLRLEITLYLCSVLLVVADRRENVRLLQRGVGASDLLGRGAAFVLLDNDIEGDARVADTDAPVLVLWEGGRGQDRVNKA